MPKTLKNTEIPGKMQSSAPESNKAENTAITKNAEDQTEIKADPQNFQKQTAKIGQRQKKYQKQLYFAVALLIAGLSGGIIALFSAAALKNTGFRSPSALTDAASDTAQWALKKQDLQTQLTAHFAEQERQQAIKNAAFEQKLQQLAKKIATAATLPFTDDTLNYLQKTQKEQAQAIVALQQTLTAKTDALHKEMAILSQQKQDSQKEVAELIALQNFQTAFYTQAPYATELQIFKAAFPRIWAKATENNPNLSAALTYYQEIGLPDKAALAVNFTALADKLVANGNAESGAAANRNATNWQKIQSYFSSFITVRRQGFANGDSVDAVLARMERALTEGADKTALFEAEKLPPETQQKMQTVLTPLRLYIMAQNLFRQAGQSIFPTQIPMNAAAKVTAEPAGPFLP